MDNLVILRFSVSVSKTSSRLVICALRVLASFKMPSRIRFDSIKRDEQWSLEVVCAAMNLSRRVLPSSIAFTTDWWRLRQSRCWRLNFSKALLGSVMLFPSPFSLPASNSPLRLP